MRVVITALLIVVEVVSAVLLIGVILIQKTKSQGMGLAFGSGMGESLFGAQIGNVITKITVTLAIVFLVNTALLAVLQAGARGGSVTDSIAVQAPVPPPQQPPPMPQAPPSIPEGSVLDVSAPPVPETATPVAPEEGAPVAPEAPVVAPEAAAAAPAAPAAPATPDAPDGDAATPSE